MKIGIEVLATSPSVSKAWGRCALLCNQASVTQNFKSSWDLLRDLLGPELVAFFGPQHGFHATVQDNMIETGHYPSGPFGLPVYSLYSETREPLPEMLDQVDTILVDLQIVGCRVYTFKYTIAGCMRMAKKLGKRVVVLDRPNPLGGKAVEGRVLDLGARSFVGEFAIPLRHGLTVGETAKFFNEQIGAELQVIPMEAWNPEAYWSDYYRHWILTSPNLPSIDSVYAFPATVMLEGTNLSEGRGTGLPFQFVGAPYIKNGQEYAARVQDYYRSAGFFLRPTEFQPTSQKWMGEVCRGFQIHILDTRQLHTFPLGLAIMRAAMDLAPNDFAWKQPPYEYDFVNLPIDLILGRLNAHMHIQENFRLDDPLWSAGIAEYLQKVEKNLLYPRTLHYMQG